MKKYANNIESFKAEFEKHVKEMKDHNELKEVLSGLFKRVDLTRGYNFYDLNFEIEKIISEASKFVFFGSAMEYLTKHDPQLNYSIQLVPNKTLGEVNSTDLASELKQEILKELWKNEKEDIERMFKRHTLTMLEIETLEEAEIYAEANGLELEVYQESSLKSNDRFHTDAITSIMEWRGLGKIEILAIEEMDIERQNNSIYANASHHVEEGVDDHVLAVLIERVPE